MNINEILKKIEKKFEVMEDSGGGITLFVYDDNEIVEYVHTGYEYKPEQLLEDLESLADGDNPVEAWDGNLIDELDFEESGYENLQEYRESFDDEIGWDIIADNNGTYPERMGAAGKEVFLQ